MKKGISLISLIITIIVIIILAAIVIFSGLSTPNSASFAGFTQQVDNVYQAVMNKYGDLKAKHAIANEYRTDEQIYIEIAVAGDPEQYATMGTTEVTNYKEGTKIESSTGIQNIDVEAATNKDHSIGMTLPKVRESNQAWYITKDGKVFNANGYTYDGKTYFTGSLYQVGELPSANTRQEENAKKIYEAIQSGTNIVNGATGTGGTVATDGNQTPDSETPEPETPTYTAYTIGQEVKVGEEYFYVLEASDSTQSTVTLLAKYNLNSSGTAQAPNATYEDTKTAFSSTNYWASAYSTYTDWSTKKLDLNTVNGEVAGDAIYKAKAYATAKGGTNGRLLTYEEADALKTSYGDMIWGKANRQGLDFSKYYLHYWLSSAGQQSNEFVYNIFGDAPDYNTNEFDYDGHLGVRPVITVSKDIVIDEVEETQTLPD